MAIIKCKMCGGDVDLTADKTFGTCEYCGCTMTFPKVDADEQRAAAFNRGNHFRRIGEFDKALQVYERIVRENDADAEAHWCCALCRFGIEYVEDPTTFEWLPTCHRASFDSFLEDVDYLAAVEHSEGITRRQYQKDAAKIAEVQRGILATSQNAEPFDVFICYKESDENGDRTRDSMLAQDIYYQLTEQGRKVFFARITLEDMVGKQYEPYIFAALNSAKVMIVVGTKPEHLSAVWVKNEWSRFLAMMKTDHNKLLLPCYRDMDPYDMPEQLSVLQSYDMSKIGFIQDLIRGISKVLDASAPKAPVVKETVVTTGTANTAPLLKRAFMFLEDGDWSSADEYCEKVLDIDPECAQAYLGKLMAELRMKKQEQLKDCAEPFDGKNNYQKALRFADDALKAALPGYIEHIKTRNEKTRLETLYKQATGLMQTAAVNAINREANYTKAAQLFEAIAGHEDSAALAQECRVKAEEDRKYKILFQAKSKMVGMSVKNYGEAIKMLEPIRGWRDVDQQISACQAKIKEINAANKAAQEEKERQLALEAKIHQERAKRTKKITIICAAILCTVIALVIITKDIIIPAVNYSNAVALMENGEYEKAIAAFDALEGYKDSKDRIEECKYADAVALIHAKKYLEAYNALLALDGYKDSTELAKDALYKHAEATLKQAEVGKYVVLGSYEQDNDTSNGKEPIEWLVLAKEGNKILVISRYALDCQPYHKYETSVTWSTCSLRSWLNNTFLDDAFSEKEKSTIPTITASLDLPQDQVFLLDRNEANLYFSSSDSRKCVATAYARAQGAKTMETEGYSCPWWLQTSKVVITASYVSYLGTISISGIPVNDDSCAVRPAMWIDLSKIS